MQKACPKETIDIDKDSHPQYFEPDCFYSDEEPITLGNVTAYSMLTRGHTIGCTSFFWEVTNPANGERYVVGMHGGVDANTMNDKYYAQSEYLTPDLRDRFLADAEKVGNIRARTLPCRVIRTRSRSQTGPDSTPTSLSRFWMTPSGNSSWKSVCARYAR